jgi:maleylacetate reductase
MEFNYQSFANKVIFGQNLVPALEAELALDAAPQNVLLIASARYRDLVAEISPLPHLHILLHIDQVAQHVPADLVRAVLDKIHNKNLHKIISIGGGSSIGLAKALALETALPIWAVPTTYSGSEMTNMYGITADGAKKVGRDDRVLPQKVFYDAALSLNMPLSLAACSAMNALAHLVEAFYSPSGNPVTQQNAITGMGHLLEGLRALAIQKQLSAEINEQLLLGACLSGKCLCEVNMALHHKLAHVIGGNYRLDHAQTHTVLLPHVLAYQWPYLTESLQADFKRVFANPYPPAAIKTLAQQLGIPISLVEIGFQENQIEATAAAIAKQQFENPAPVEMERLRVLLKETLNGDLPGN